MARIAVPDNLLMRTFGNLEVTFRARKNEVPATASPEIRGFSHFKQAPIAQRFETSQSSGRHSMSTGTTRPTGIPGSQQQQHYDMYRMFSMVVNLWYLGAHCQRLARLLRRHHCSFRDGPGGLVFFGADSTPASTTAPGTKPGAWRMLGDAGPKYGVVGAVLVFAFAASTILGEVGRGEELTAQLSRIDAPAFVLALIVGVIVLAAVGPADLHGDDGAVGSVAFTAFVSAGIPPILAAVAVQMSASTEGPCRPDLHRQRHRPCRPDPHLRSAAALVRASGAADHDPGGGRLRALPAMSATEPLDPGSFPSTRALDYVFRLGLALFLLGGVVLVAVRPSASPPARSASKDAARPSPARSSRSVSA